MSLTVELERRIRQYVQQHGMVLGEQLGFGVHGIVFTAESQPGTDTPTVRSAIKVLRDEPPYFRERDVYLRLQDQAVTRIRNCHVPQLLRFDDGLWIIEMTVVSRPFVLDFAGAYLDRAPDFSDEVVADWAAEKQEQFGGHWHEVQAILAALEGYGIHMIDVNPGNISFGD